jgi:hypothetical protein
VTNLDASAMLAIKHLAEIERAKERGAVERDLTRSRMVDEMRNGTPRAQRATHHARSMFHTVSKFVPEACREDAYDELLLSFFWGNFEIVQVPPDRDRQEAASIRASMMELPTYRTLTPKD